MIDKIHACCRKILPLVYDQTLSYYEELCKVVAKINEVIDYVQNVTVEQIQEIVNNAVVESSYDESTETLTITIRIE